MKYLSLLLLISCVSTQKAQYCKLTEVVIDGPLIATIYDCGEYTKVCRRDGENNRSLGCYVSRLK